MQICDDYNSNAQTHSVAVLKVDTLLNCDSDATFKTLSLISPLSISGSVETIVHSNQSDSVEHVQQPQSELEMQKYELPGGDRQVLFYTPDEEEASGAGETGKVDGTYVPPFNNPLYPNNSYSTYGSVIGE